MTVGVLCAVAALVGFGVVIAFWPLRTRCRGRVYFDDGWRQCTLEERFPPDWNGHDV